MSFQDLRLRSIVQSSERTVRIIPNVKGVPILSKAAELPIPEPVDMREGTPHRQVASLKDGKIGSERRPTPKAKIWESSIFR